MCIHYSDDSLTAGSLMTHLFWFLITARATRGKLMCPYQLESIKLRKCEGCEFASRHICGIEALRENSKWSEQMCLRMVDTERRYFSPQQLYNLALQLHWWIQCAKRLTCELSIKIREGRSVLDSRSDCLPNCCCRWRCRASYLLPTFACNGCSRDTGCTC